MFLSSSARLLSCLLLLTALAALPARADDPAAPNAANPNASAPNISASATGAEPLPLSTNGAPGRYDAGVSKPLTIAQQRARYEADQRMLRMQWNKWIGYEPLRPAMPNPLTNNEMNPYYMQPTRIRPVWSVWNYGSRPWPSRVW